MRREAARPAQQAEAGDLAELVVERQVGRASQVLAAEGAGGGDRVHQPLLALGGGDDEGVGERGTLLRVGSLQQGEKKEDIEAHGSPVP